MTRLALCFFVLFLPGAVIIACGPSEPTCEECLAQQSAALTPDGCRPYCEDGDGPVAVQWVGETTFSPIILARDPAAAQPPQVSYSSIPTLSATSLAGVCDSPIPLSARRFRSSPGMTCRSVALPSFLAADSPDRWYQCDGAPVIIHSLDVYIRADGSLYAEGGVLISGCGRTWDTVLLQVRGVRQ